MIAKGHGWQWGATAYKRLVHFLCAFALVFGIVSGQLGRYEHDHVAGHGTTHHHDDKHDYEPDDHAILLTALSGGIVCETVCDEHTDVGLHAHDTGIKLQTGWNGHTWSAPPRLAWSRPNFDYRRLHVSNDFERPPPRGLIAPFRGLGAFAVPVKCC